MLVKVLCAIIVIESIALIITIACLISKTKQLNGNKRQLSWYNMSHR